MKKSLAPVLYFAVHYPLRALTVTLAFLISSVSEGLGVLALLPLLQLVLGGEVGRHSKITALFHQVFDALHLDLTLFNTLTVFTGLIVFKSITKVAAMYIVSASAAKITADFRSRLVEAIMGARWLYFTGKPAGHVSTAINNEPQQAANCIVIQCSFIAESLQIVTYLAIATFISWWVTLAAVVLGGLGTLLLRRVFRKAGSAGQEQTDTQKALMANVLDAIKIMKPLRAMAREDRLKPFIHQNIAKLRNAYKWIVFSPHVIEQSNEVLKVVGLAAGFYILLDVWGGGLEILLLLAVVFLRVLQRLSVLQKNYVIIAAQVPAFTYTLETITEAESAREQWHGTQVPTFNKGITFENVTYRHKDKDIFKNASFSIPKNGLTMLAGPSGIGKSTLVDLICGLYDVDQGRILVDGTDLKNLDIAQWRRCIGYVPQDSVLLNDSVRNNITLHDDTLTDEQIWSALEKAGASAFVRNMPDKLDSITGESGGRLSGGQKQRLIIARALVRKPDVLILDEATSGLEDETEEAIFNALSELKHNLTIIAIAHDKGLQRYADEIYTLENHILLKAT
jgi:ATP-binding cassette subfamily C protein